MELEPQEWNLTNSQDFPSDSNKFEESNKHEHPDDTGTVSTKKRKLSEDSENLECLNSLRHICEAVLGDDASTLPAALPTEQSDVKQNITSTQKKKKKKKVLTEAANKSKEVKPKNEKLKAHMRKNIRDILKGDELEAETRAAQQREIERVQRIQQQQQQQVPECSYIPHFDEEDNNTPVSTLVEDLQALAQELEDSTLSPDIPIQFLENNQHFKQTSQPPTVDTVKNDNHEMCLKKQVYDDVICLSSDDEEYPPKPTPQAPACSKHYVPDDDDDDVVILSGDDEKPELIEEDSDVHNFGLHTRDELNKPDSEGRVLVNVGHPSSEGDIFLAPQLARAAKAHQIGGIRFLYDNVVESLEQFSSSEGFGCILAHSMGLGKTFQVCAFSEVFLRHTKARTILIIVPINTIQNWVSEFNHWLPSELSPDMNEADPPVQLRSFNLHVLNDTTKDLNSRSKVIADWASQGGVLLIGYELYRLFYTQRESKEKKRSKVPKKKKVSGFIDLEEEEKEKGRLENIYQALVNPGPELIICDEGHRIKNMKTSISVALKEVRTRRRVVLTGYPLQNNLLEYWCMVDFVRPNFLGTRTEFGNMFERPIQNGQCVDSNPADVKLMKERVYVLHSLVKGFVQRRSHAVLRNSLPHKEEHVLLLRMTKLQRELYKHYMSQLLLNKSVSNPLKAFAVCLKIWNHPDVLFNFFKKGKDDLDLELDEEAPESRKKKKNCAVTNVPLMPSLPTPISVPTDDEAGDSRQSVLIAGSFTDQGANDCAKEKKDEVASLDWANEILKGYIPGDVENAAKTKIFFTILEESVKIGDRLLVFSQSLFTLNMLEEFLQQRPIPLRGEEHWCKNKSYFRLDGSTTGMEREKLVNEFNANADILLFLISTRAGSLGINLIGANRVIVFDASWNPCHDAQAVCRVYRYGQQKQCFIYRLVTDNSLEKKIYDRQIGKQGTADRVVDELNPEARLSLKEVTSLVCDDEDDPPPKDFGDAYNHDSKLRITDSILGQVLQRWGSSFTKDPFEHGTLLLEGKDSGLSKAEKRMAQRLYEKAKLDGSMQYRRQNYSSYYPKMPVPIPSMDNSNGAYGRPNPMYLSGRPSNIPIKHTTSSPLQGMGMDLLAEALAQGKLICKEMVLTKDVTIARNQISGGTGETSPIVLSSGTRVKLIKTPKGIYMQTPEGKIFRIHSAAPATPASPSAIAAALGLNLKTPYSSIGVQDTPAVLPSYSGGSKSSLMEQSMLKRIREMQQKSSIAESAKQVISFNDKSALLAQIRQNLAGNKGLGNTLGNITTKMSRSSSTTSKDLPSVANNSSLTHFAKQLASLAQKSAADLLTDVGVGCSQSDFDSTSNSGMSPKRTSSLLDPKARALPSASLPKKVATVTPNVSKARIFTPRRPTATVEPLSKIPPIVDHSSPMDSSLVSRTISSTPTALSALSTLSASPLSAVKSPNFNRPSEFSSDLVDFATKNAEERQPALDSSASTRNGSGIFDNLSLASQLEGFASCTSAAARPTAESLKDLLKPVSNAAGETIVTGLQWSGDQTTAGGIPSWSDSQQFSTSQQQWNNTGQWNDAASTSSQVNWPWSSQQLQPQQCQANFASASRIGSSSSSGPTTPSTDSYNQYSNNFDTDNQWVSYNNMTTAANATYPSHSLPPPNGHYSTPPYFPTSYFGSNAPVTPAYATYPQNSQPGYNTLDGSNFNNQYNNHGGNDFTPNYSQPYPGSYSQ